MTDDRAADVEPSFTPRLNHVAISLDPAVLDAHGRADVVAFYGAVFGWTEADNTGEKGNPLILNTGTYGQFVYLLPADPYLHAPALDHFGMQVATIAELDATLTRARDFQRGDDRVRIIERSERTTHGPTHDYVLTNGYIGYLLPLMIELQHLQRVARASQCGALTSREAGS